MFVLFSFFFCICRSGEREIGEPDYDGTSTALLYMGRGADSFWPISVLSGA